jgi:hypothetical protein
VASVLLPVATGMVAVLGLHACGDVHGVADGRVLHAARRADAAYHGGPGVDADPDGERRFPSCREVADRTRASLISVEVT